MDRQSSVLSSAVVDVIPSSVLISAAVAVTPSKYVSSVAVDVIPKCINSSCRCYPVSVLISAASVVHLRYLLSLDVPSLLERFHHPLPHHHRLITS